MEERLNIYDRFNVTGRGMLYMVDFPEKIIIRLGDEMCDNKGHRFKVKGMDMGRKVPDIDGVDFIPLILWFENIDGVEIEEDTISIQTDYLKS